MTSTTVVQNPSVITLATNKVSLAWKDWRGKAHGQIFTRSEDGDKVCIYSIGDQISIQDKASTDGTIRPLQQDRLDVYPNFVSPDTDFHFVICPDSDKTAETIFKADDAYYTLKRTIAGGPQELNHLLRHFSHDNNSMFAHLFMEGEINHLSNGEHFKDNHGICDAHTGYYYSTGVTGYPGYEIEPEKVTTEDKSILRPSDKDVRDLAQIVANMQNNIVDRSNA